MNRQSVLLGATQYGEEDDPVRPRQHRRLRDDRSTPQGHLPSVTMSDASQTRARPSDRVCYWCGAQNPTERDHIFPRNLFQEPRPQLLTVAACTSHNRVFSDDEEYFREFMVGGSYGHPEARALWESKSRVKFRRSRRYASMLLSQVAQRKVRSRAGLFLGHLYTFHPDGSRIQRVFRKMIRGLYSNHHGETRSLGPISMKLWQHSLLSPIPKDIFVLLSQTRTTPVGHVRYRFAASEEPAEGQPVALGTVHFFDRMHFVFAAYPSAENDRLERPTGQNR